MNELTANMKTEEAIKEKIKESRFESINGKDLMEMDLPPLHYAISTILPHGFFILAGGAKVGKSWLAEQISYAVASGGQIWGYQAIQSEVLYLGLEDTVTRLQSRFEMLEAYEGMLQLPQANGNHKANGARVSQRTVYDCKKIISRAFKYATDELELITENPMLGVTVKQPKSSRREVWTEEQFNFAYDNCSDPQLKLLISLMVALSSRIGECLALTWSDVYDNEDKHEPSYIRNYKELTYRTEKFIKETNGRGILKVFDQVRSTRPDAKRRAVFHVTKTEKEIEAKTDRIYIAPEVIFMLRDYRLVQNQHKQLAGDSYIDDDLIFAHEDGTHISSQYADDMFRSLYEPLGLPKVDLYSLRHFSITKKLDYNRHDYVSLAKDTAHRQLSTIQDYYETPEDSVRIDTAKAIGKFLSRSGKSDSESKVTISLKDEDFAKKLEEVASDSAGKQMLEFAIAMYEKNNSD